jgi:hypothetical protein
VGLGDGGANVLAFHRRISARVASETRTPAPYLIPRMLAASGTRRSRFTSCQRSAGHGPFGPEPRARNVVSEQLHPRLKPSSNRGIRPGAGGDRRPPGGQRRQAVATIRTGNGLRPLAAIPIGVDHHDVGTLGGRSILPPDQPRQARARLKLKLQIQMDLRAGLGRRGPNRAIPFSALARAIRCNVEIS